MKPWQTCTTIWCKSPPNGKYQSWGFALAIMKSWTLTQETFPWTQLGERLQLTHRSQYGSAKTTNVRLGRAFSASISDAHDVYTYHKPLLPDCRSWRTWAELWFLSCKISQSSKKEAIQWTQLTYTIEEEEPPKLECTLRPVNSQNEIKDKHSWSEHTDCLPRKY